MTEATIRDYRTSDADSFNRIAIAAFSQFQHSYEDWPAMRTIVSKASALSDAGEVVIAESDGRLVGGVAYVGPHVAKAPFFEQAWPVIRMLVVEPDCRGKGIGRALTDQCMARAQRDRAPVIALHTSPIMTVALPMYLRMGFAWVRDAPPLFGVPYAVYTKAL
jgi:ribosomal protein S18 acetylase RimI-like enzyme